MNSIDILFSGTRQDSFEGDVKTSVACNSSSVLVRGDEGAVIIDTGAVGYGDKLLAALKGLGVDPADIDVVVNTHSHQDHTYNNHLFPDALVYTSTSVWHPHDGNKVVIYGDITKVPIPCIRLINTPGHMLGHVSAVAESGGKRYVVAGDAIRESVIRSGIIPKKYADARAYLDSMLKVFEIADIIIPGHGNVIDGELLKELADLAKKCRVGD